MTDIYFPDLIVSPQRLPARVLEMVEVTPAGRRHLYYNDRVSNEECRFGIAHGLHHLLDDLAHVTGLRECNQGLRMLEQGGFLPPAIVEIRCDIFAAEILVPLDVLDRYAPANLSPQNTDERELLRAQVHQLASLFKVPRQLMASRLRDLRALRVTSYFVK